MAAAQKAKGSAEGATSPSHGSTHQEMDQEMNGTTHTTTAAGAPASIDALALTIDRARLANMRAEHLKNLAYGISAMLEMGSGLACQPRFQVGGDEFAYNDAGDFLERLNECLGTLIDAIYKAAEECEPKTARDVEHRAWCLLSLRAGWQDELSEVAVAAVEAVRDVEKAKFREAHAARTARAAA